MVAGRTHAHHRVLRARRHQHQIHVLPQGTITSQSCCTMARDLGLRMGPVLVSRSWRSSIYLCVWQSMVAGRSDAHTAVSCGRCHRNQIRGLSASHLETRRHSLDHTGRYRSRQRGHELETQSRISRLHLSVWHPMAKDRGRCVSRAGCQSNQICFCIPMP